MGYIAYGFVEKDMFDAEECFVEVFKTQKEAIEAMENKAYKDIGFFVRDLGCAPVVTVDRENNQITVINCSREECILYTEQGEKLPRTDYRVIEVKIHE